VNVLQQLRAAVAQEGASATPPVPTYDPPITLEPYQRNAIYSLDGHQVEVSCFPQTALERLAARLGA
jgi:hypothetical protein